MISAEFEDLRVRKLDFERFKVGLKPFWPALQAAHDEEQLPLDPDTQLSG